MTHTEKKEIEAVGKKPIEKSGGESIHENVMYVPDVDIIEDAEAITLFADLPGVQREGLSIDVRDGVLTLVGKVEAIEERFHPIYREYQEGGFSRKFNLGEQIDPGQISAKLTNGVLTLVLPKAESHKPRKIQIS